MCVRRRAEGGGSARALAGTRMREPRLISDRGVVCGSAQRGGTRLETLLAWRVSAFTAGAAWIPVWRTRRHPVFACLRASGGTRPRNVGGGGAAGRGWPSLGVMAAVSFVWYWEALWLTPGRRRVPGGRGPGKEDGMGVLFFPGSFRRPFRFSPGSAGSAGPAPRPGRLRFRSGKFCDAEDWGGVGAGRGGRNGPLGSGDRG